MSNQRAKKLLEQDGLNVITQKKKTNLIKRFLLQFKDFMVIILLLAAVASAVISNLIGEHDYADPIIILFIVTLNAIIGFIQENKAEKSIEALKKLTVPIVKVIRNKNLQIIPSQEIVCGDLILFEAGDFIPADGRLVSTNKLKIDESALTGESLAVEKKHDVVLKKDSLLADRINMVYCGSYVSYGRGKAIVVNTGLNTEVGKIASMIMEQDDNITPLQKKLDKTGKILGTSALAICVAIFVMGLLRNNSFFEMFMTSVSLAVAAIPEGLPAIVTVVLAIGVRRMAKQKAIVKKLPAVETLGSASVICSDKTGTLTQNKMRVVEDYTIDFDKDLLVKFGCLCNNSSYEKEKSVGDPTEIALVEYAQKKNLDKKKLEKEYKRMDELVFDSERKLMTTVHKTKNQKKFLVITKGAPDILVLKCNLKKSDKDKILEQNKNMASRALRVLAVAYKEIENYKEIKSKDNSNNLECELNFCGLLGIIDPPREEVFDAVQECKNSGIKVVVITGDHILTAESIAKNLGIMKENDKSISGLELNKISDEELSKKVYAYSVFARVSPEHKVKIIKAFKSHNAIVAMTGDGVNDAPALKIADIGCAMGITGTDVAKSAADIILTDDNFATIVKAVKEGRSIFSNIKKTVHFLLSSNIGEIVTIFLAILFGWQSPLLAIQLLWINLVTDSLPAIALGVELPEDDIMRRPPEFNLDGLFTRELWQNIFLEGTMIGLLSLIAYGIGNLFYHNLMIARTMTFTTLGLSQLVHVFNIRSEKSIFLKSLFNNIYIIFAFIICLILQVIVVIIPEIASVFKVKPLNPSQWLIILFLSLIPILVVEFEKIWSIRDRY